MLRYFEELSYRLKTSVRRVLKASFKQIDLKAFLHLRNASNRKVIKFTGIGNNASKVRYYRSFYHFINNIPSIINPKDYDYLICQNFLNDEFIASKKPKVFFTREPNPYMKNETKRNLNEEGLKPFLYLYDDPDIKNRMFYVALDNDRKPIIKKLKKRIFEKRKRLCCIINRYFESDELNLWRERVRFVNAMGNDIDIYGYKPWHTDNKWENYENYLGPVSDKFKTMSKYTFALAFENTDSPGYITEKIIHAMITGTVPLYWGGGTYLNETIPDGCYINCRGKDPASIYRMIKSMDHESIVGYRKAAINFLELKEADRFTYKYWAEAIINRLQGKSS